MMKSHFYFSKVSTKYFKNKSVLIFLGIFLFGSCIRLLKAFFLVAVDQDEANTYLETIQYSFLEHIYRNNPNYTEHGHPPLSFLIFKKWLSLIDYEWSFRVLTTICSLITMLLAIELFKIIFPKGELKFLSSYYFATSLFFIFLGIFFRGYSPAIMFTLAACLAFIIAFNSDKKNKKNKKNNWINYWGISFFTTLACLFDYSSFWPLFSLFLFCLIRKYYNYKSFKYLIVGFLGFLPWVLFSIIKNFTFAVMDKSESLEKNINIVGLFREISKAYDLKFLISYSHYFVILTMLAYLIAIYGAYQYRKKNSDLSLFLFIGLIVPYFSMGIFSLFFVNVFDFKHLWFSNLCLMLGLLITVSELKGQKIKWSLYIFFVVIQLFTIRLKYRDYELGKVYETSESKLVLSYIENQTKGDKARLFVSPQYEWSSTVWLYNKWKRTGNNIEIERLPNLKEPLILYKEKYFFFFDLDDDLNLDKFNLFAAKIKCTPLDINGVLSRGMFRKCIRNE